MNIKLLSLALILGFAFMACGDDDPEPEDCSSPDITYTSGVKAILDGSCAVSGCHVDADLAGDFSLEDYATASGAAAFGRMVGAINHSDNFSAMPPSGTKIAQCDIDKITAWIAAGTPE